MTSPDVVLENHTLVVRDGRILDLLPSAEARLRYAPTMHVDRPEHLLLPGLVNAWTRTMPAAGRFAGLRRPVDGALLCMAEMLRAGTTCFSDVGYFPDESARLAAEQGMRILVGIPIAAASSPWAGSADECLTRALRFRDEFRGHPTIGTVFAPLGACGIDDVAFGRVATLANELDAGIVIALHESRSEIEECVAHHGLRPIERLQSLGLLTPALTAVHMVHVNAADIALAQRSAIAVSLCPGSSLRRGFGAPPVPAWVGSGLRLGAGTGVETSAASLDLWSELKLLALLSRTPQPGGAALRAWDAIAVATRGGAAALGLDAEIGTLETGKWADLCCVDLAGPALLRAFLHEPAPDPIAALVFNAGRDTVNDVWVAGRQLLNGGAFTRLDWPELAARVQARPNPATTGERS